MKTDIAAIIKALEVLLRAQLEQGQYLSEDTRKDLRDALRTLREEESPV